MTVDKVILTLKAEGDWPRHHNGDFEMFVNALNHLIEAVEGDSDFVDLALEIVDALADRFGRDRGGIVETGAGDLGSRRSRRLRRDPSSWKHCCCFLAQLISLCTEQTRMMGLTF
jgi:hypothetical protein